MAITKAMAKRCLLWIVSADWRKRHKKRRLTGSHVHRCRPEHIVRR
jgi:hypothetical protein